MKTQEEYAREINEIVLHDVESHQTQGFYRCNDAGTLPGECADFIFRKYND